MGFAVHAAQALSRHMLEHAALPSWLESDRSSRA
jgi:hypothetical protein